MSNWRESIPTEILSIIFLYLNNDDQLTAKKNLAQCALTCRHWKDPAQRAFFSEITLRDSSDIEKLCQVVLNNKKIERWVRVLYCNRIDGWNAVVLLGINSILPNLEKIDFQGSDSLYSSFCKILTEGEKFNNLKTFPNPINHRITSIGLFNDNSNTGSLYQELHNKLSQYPKLKKVVIHIPDNNIHFKDVTEYFESVIKNNSMPSLQDLSLISIEDSSYVNIYTSSQDTLLPTKSLKEMYIALHSKAYCVPSEKFMLFIMNNFPNLDTFICMKKNDDRSYICGIQSDSFMATLLQFIIFLSKMRYCLFPGIPLPSLSAIKHIEDFYVSEDKKGKSLSMPTRSFKIVNSFFSQECAEDAAMITFQNRSLKQQEISLLLACKKKPDNLDLEQLNPIKQIGRFFDNLSLKIESVKNFIITLSHITKYCTRLHTLSISGSGLQSEEKFYYLEDSVRSYSVKTLILINCVLSQEQLFYIVAQFPNLVKLVLKNCFMHKTVLGQRFYSISLPISLECLEIEFGRDFKRRESYCLKLMTDTDHNSRYCCLIAQINSIGQTIGYSTLKFDTPGQNSIGDVNESVFRDTILENTISTYIIYCHSVKNFTIKYIAKNGRHREKIELLSSNGSVM